MTEYWEEGIDSPSEALRRLRRVLDEGSLLMEDDVVAYLAFTEDRKSEVRKQVDNIFASLGKIYGGLNDALSYHDHGLTGLSDDAIQDLRDYYNLWRDFGEKKPPSMKEANERAALFKTNGNIVEGEVVSVLQLQLGDPDEYKNLVDTIEPFLASLPGFDEESEEREQIPRPHGDHAPQDPVLHDIYEKDVEAREDELEDFIEEREAVIEKFVRFKNELAGLVGRVEQARDQLGGFLDVRLRELCGIEGDSPSSVHER